MRPLLLSPLFAVGLVMLGSRAAQAQPSPSLARLEYARGPEASACPDEEAIRSGIAARLGYAPFRPDAAPVVRAKVQRTQTGLVASVQSFDSEGNLRGERELSSPAQDCTELASALELAIAMAVDPLVLTRPQPTPVVVVERHPPPPTPAPKPREPLLLEGGVGVLGALGTTPSPTVGVLGGVALHSRAWGMSFGVELRADLPGGAEFRGGWVRAQPSFASFVPCLRVGRFGGCAVASGGVLSSSARDLPDAKEALTPFAAGGLRLQFDTPLGGPLRLRLQAEALGAFTRTTLRVGDVEVWSNPVAGASMGVVFLLAPR